MKSRQPNPKKQTIAKTSKNGANFDPEIPIPIIRKSTSVNLSPPVRALADLLAEFAATEILVKYGRQPLDTDCDENHDR